MEPTFFQSRQSPVIFRRELLDDATCLQFRRQHFPGVGFHFEVGTDFRIRRQKVQGAEQMVIRVVKRRQGGAVQRNVKMNAPFFGVTGDG